MTLRSLLRQLLPPALARLAPRRRRRYGFFGDYPDWAGARAASAGYDQEAILERVLAAMREVRDGRAACERDSCLFDSVQYAWPLLTGLLWAAARNGGALRVMDYGGSLGSLYFQGRAFLAGLPLVRWGVVEQPAFVHAGRREFEDGTLAFFENAADCAAALAPNTAVFSSVLQYLEDPRAALEQALAHGCTTLLLDRLPVIDGPQDRLCVQRVDPALMAASYPCRLFSEQRLRRSLDGLRIVAEFPGADPSLGLGSRYMGFIIDCAPGG